MDDKKHKIQKDINEIKDFITSDNIGSTAKVSKKTDEVIRKSNKLIKTIDKKLNGSGVIQTNKSNVNKSLYEVIQKSIDYIKKLNQTDVSVFDDVNKKDYMTSSGARFLPDGYDSSGYGGEEEIISSFKKMLNERLAAVQEYRKVIYIIPQVSKAIDMLVRDTINASNLNTDIFGNVFSSSIFDSNVVNDINKDIHNMLIDDFKLDSKLEMIFREAFISGASPVVVYSFKDITELITQLKKDKLNDDVTLSKENINSILDEKINEENKKVSLFNIENKFNLSKEDFLGFENYYDNKDDNDTKAKKFKLGHEKLIVDSILKGEDFDLIEDFKQMAYESVITDIKERLELSKIRDNKNSDNIDNEYNGFVNSIINREFKNVDEILERAIIKYVKDIDDKVSIITPQTHAFNKLKYDIIKNIDLSATGGSLISNDDGFAMFNYDIKNSNYKQNKLEQNSNTEKNQTNKKNKKIHNKTQNKIPFMRMYDVEDVIPVVNAGEHIGYYVLERDAHTKNGHLRRGLNGSFTDIFIKNGMNHDKELMNNFSSISNLNNNTLNSGMQPIGNLTYLTPSSNVTAQFDNVINEMFDSDVFKTSTDAKKNNEILIDIFKKIIDRKLEKINGFLLEDTFKNNLLNLLYNNILIGNDIKITYLPTDKVVYFSNSLDRDGYPVSVLADTLTDCFMYMVYLFTNQQIQMNRAKIRDLVHVDVGQNMNANRAALQIKKDITTSRLASRLNVFNGSYEIIKKINQADLMIIPIYNENAAFGYEQLEPRNNVEVDPEMMQHLLKNIISNIGIPYSSFIEQSENDTATQLKNTSQQYVTTINKHQKTMSDHITKLIRILCNESGIVEKYNINPYDINFRLKTPSKLYSDTLVEEIQAVKGFAEEMVNIYIPESKNTDLDNITKDLMRISIIKQKVGENWEIYDSIHKQATAEALSLLTSNKKSEEITASINESESESYENDEQNDFNFEETDETSETDSNEEDFEENSDEGDLEW